MRRVKIEAFQYRERRHPGILPFQQRVRNGKRDVENTIKMFERGNDIVLIPGKQHRRWGVTHRNGQGWPEIQNCPVLPGPLSLPAHDKPHSQAALRC